MKILKFYIFISIIFISCNSKPKQNEDIHLNHFENEIYDYKYMSASQKLIFIDKYKFILGTLYNNDYNDSTLSEIHNSPIYTAFYDDVKNKFNDDNYIKDQIAEVFNSYTKSYKSSFPAIYTIITPYNQSIMHNDSVIAIGLNHYLGEEHPMYNYYEEYLRKNKKGDRIKFDIAEVLSRNLLDNNFEKKTLLDEMLYEGIVLNIEQSLLPNSSIQEIMGYTEDEMNWSKKNESEIWQKYISSDILYSTSMRDIAQNIMDAPFTASISQESPSKLGRYIGYRIIKSYLNKNNKNIIDCYNNIMTENSQSILLNSHYNGK